MTYQQFLAELRDSPRFWQLTSVDGSIRFNGQFKAGDCPITAVCLRKTGKLFSHDECQEAAKVLGLDPFIADRIARASDWNTNTKIRRDLLEATGLTEKKFVELDALDGFVGVN